MYSESAIRYFKSVSNLNPLTIEQETQLGLEIKNGSKRAINELVQHNLKLVIKIAKKHQGQGVPLDDLIQEGNIGLYEAAERFNPDGETRFVTYAQLWIRKRINEEVAKHGRLVRIPHNQEYQMYKDKMAGKQVRDMRVVELDKPVGSEEDGRSVADVLFGNVAESDDRFETDALKFKVTRLLSRLQERERMIVKAYFGIDQKISWPTDRIAEELNLTPTRVSQILKGALTQLAC
jgi:RNA polymerase primary sigma factor